MSRTSQFDIVVWGATGFTGRLVCEYLLDRCGAGRGATVLWAMAGRSLEGLTEARDAIGAVEVPLIIADATDPGSLLAMLSQTQVILSTVGPYQLYGSELIAICAELGVDYVDLCGEPGWMARTIGLYHPRAARTGARIVHSCGFDSIPFELGVDYVQELALARWGATATSVKGRVLQLRGGLSGGSAASGHATMAAVHRDPSLAALLADPFALTPGFEGPPQPPGDQPYFDEDLQKTVAPFIMASVNTKNVHRANFLRGHPYGVDFTYDEMEVVQPQTAFPMSAFGPEGPKPGEGPSKAERDAGFFDLVFIAHGPEGQQVRAAVSGDADPGYGSSAKMIAEAAICLVEDCPPGRGGVWTPGALIGQALRQRLVDRAGLTFAAAGAQ